MGDHDDEGSPVDHLDAGEVDGDEVDAGEVDAPTPSLNLDELDPSDWEPTSADDATESRLGRATTGIADAVFGSSLADSALGSTKSTIANSVLGSASAISGHYRLKFDEIAGYQSSMAKAAGLIPPPALSSMASVMAEQHKSFAGLPGIQSSMAKLAGLIPPPAVSSMASVMAEQHKSFAGLPGIQSSMAKLAGLIPPPAVSSMASVMAENLGTFAKIAGYESSMAKAAGLIPPPALSSMASSLSVLANAGVLAATRPAWARNFVVEPGTPAIKAPPPSRLILPHEAATEAEARDFLRLLHLALLTVQSKGRTGCQELLRLARSTPSKATGLTLAVSTVYLLMQLVPDFDVVVGDLANAIEVVLFPFGAWVIARNANNK